MECRSSVWPSTSPIRRVRQTSIVCILTMAGMLSFPVGSYAQRDQRNNYYRGMHDQVRRGDYNRYSQEDESRHHHDSGGIGAGKGALIGAAGGAALGAIFGRSLKGTVIGGAAGAGAGAIGGAIANHDNNNHRRDHHR